MGHDVLSVPVPDRDYGPSAPTCRGQIERLKQQSKDYDLAIALAADRISADWWKDLQCPVAVWHVESAGRADEEFARRYEEMRRMTPHCFYPAIQDAERFGGHWLPFGVDTEVFRPVGHIKRYPVGFLGHLYGERSTFVTKLQCLGIRVDNPHTARVPWLRTEAHARAQAVELARLICECQINLNLPALSKLYVSRVTEVMACGVPFLTPILPPGANANSRAWDTGPMEYDPGNIPAMAPLLLRPDLLRERALKNLEEVKQKHTLEARLEKLLATVGRTAEERTERAPLRYQALDDMRLTANVAGREISTAAVNNRMAELRNG
jgi:hypothetical protein